MLQMDESSLSQLLLKDINIRLVEPKIYSVFPNDEVGNSYDNKVGNFYDLVACNPIYKRFMWGYSTKRFTSITQDALTLSKIGIVLDLGCGSLAFTAKIYAKYSKRPVVLLDQSLKLLKIAKSRMIKLRGNVPPNIIFLHADALQLPFAPETFNTIISLNLLHVLDDLRKVLTGIKIVSANESNSCFTTLVLGNRLTDKYLKIWEKAGELVSRNTEQLQEIFKELKMPMTCELNGNMAFIYCQTNPKEK